MRTLRTIKNPILAYAANESSSMSDIIAIMAADKARPGDIYRKQVIKQMSQKYSDDYQNFDNTCFFDDKENPYIK